MLFSVVLSDNPKETHFTDVFWPKNFFVQKMHQILLPHFFFRKNTVILWRFEHIEDSTPILQLVSVEYFLKTS